VFLFLFKQEEKKTTQKSEIFTTRSLKGKRTDEKYFSCFDEYRSTERVPAAHVSLEVA
jgi:hypothetical protein